VIDLLVSGVLVLLLDQWSKRAIDLRPADGWIAWGSVVRLRRVVNARVVYRSDHARLLLVVLWVVALASALLLHRSGVAFQSRASLLGLGATLGGAAGNLLDILRSRSVSDFIDLRWWPVFNIADIAILGGLALAFWPA